MKRKTGKIAIFSFLIINIILQILYQFVIRTKIPYDWYDIYEDVHYPQKIADHLADCFFLMNYFLTGYLVFSEKHYYDGMKEDKRTDIWRYCAYFCQIGGLVAYAVLWLGLADNPAFEPVEMPKSYVSSLLEEKFSDGRMYYYSWMGASYIDYIDVAITFVPAFLFFVIYSIHFFTMHIRRKKAGCPDKKWKRWNIIYIFVFLFIFFWTIEALRMYLLVAMILGFRWFERAYYEKNRPPDWEHWGS